jgi:hypothetical protein
MDELSSQERIELLQYTGYKGGPGGTRTRVFFSAIDEQVGEKGGKAVYYVYYVPKSPYCSSISVPKLFPNCTRSVPDMHRYKARKAIRKPVHRGK